MESHDTVLDISTLDEMLGYQAHGRRSAIYLHRQRSAKQKQGNAEHMYIGICAYLDRVTQDTVYLSITTSRGLKSTMQIFSQNGTFAARICLWAQHIERSPVAHWALGKCFPSIASTSIFTVSRAHAVNEAVHAPRSPWGNEGYSPLYFWGRIHSLRVVDIPRSVIPRHVDLWRRRPRLKHI